MAELVCVFHPCFSSLVSSITSPVRPSQKDSVTSLSSHSFLKFYFILLVKILLCKILFTFERENESTLGEGQREGGSRLH